LTDTKEHSSALFRGEALLRCVIRNQPGSKYAHLLIPSRGLWPRCAVGKDWLPPFTADIDRFRASGCSRRRLGIGSMRLSDLRAARCGCGNSAGGRVSLTAAGIVRRR
jgi:hypothetical protein